MVMSFWPLNTLLVSSVYYTKLSAYTIYKIRVSVFKKYGNQVPQLKYAKLEYTTKVKENEECEWEYNEKIY